MSHPMPTNREWVILVLYFFARHSHQSCLILWPTDGKWHCFISFRPGSFINHVSSPTVCKWQGFISLPGSLINYVSSHDQQLVGDTALYLCQAVTSLMSHPMTNRVWVTLPVLYLFARQSHQSCLIPWPTESEWQCFIYFRLINHITFHDQQKVSDTA